MVIRVKFISPHGTTVGSFEGEDFSDALVKLEEIANREETDIYMYQLVGVQRIKRTFEYEGFKT